METFQKLEGWAIHSTTVSLANPLKQMNENSTQLCLYLISISASCRFPLSFSLLLTSASLHSFPVQQAQMGSVREQAFPE